MWNSLSRGIVSGCCILACCFLCHCGARPSGDIAPEVDGASSPADRLLQAILAGNADLDTIKGIGRVKLQHGGQLDTFRAVWIGKQPDHLRLTVLAVTGQPMLSFASDGDRNYILSYADNRLYRRKASVNGLKRIISIAMTPGDLLDVLSGRLPMEAGAGARLEERSGRGPLLISKDKHRNYIDSVSLDIDRTGVREFERRDGGGKLLFRVVFDGTQETGGGRIPEVLTISNDDGALMQITIEHSWVNPDVTEDQFILKAS